MGILEGGLGGKKNDFEFNTNSQSDLKKTNKGASLENKKKKESDVEDVDPELKNTKVYFKLDLRPKIIEIPDFEDVTKVNVRYDLLPPHCSCHIFWDTNNSELMYYIEEPELDGVETEILTLVKLGLEEMINISFINATKNKMVVKYLEHNVQSILSELGARVSMETYQKIMYYVYRDFIGLNEIEPLLRDYYIEDIECNGAETPLYVVHRKFRNIKTNLIYDDSKKLTVFVEKIAQKTGRYVSYARPILDGTLPDGSRVNATYSSDVTTRGPTFTIRKFTKDPWMPTHLIKMGTATPEVFAFLWIAVEHKLNVMTIGETGAGKTTILNSVASFVPDESRIVSIEDTRELNLSHENWLPAITREGFGVANLTGEKYGEITLFDLLKESFRQNPDYVIVGEVRDQETSVLFQGMASGHSCFSTFHASSVETLVKRLQTPPISLPSSLVESMNLVISMTHIKEHERNMRRLREIDEVISIRDNGTVEYSSAFEYQPIEDTTKQKNDIYFFKVLSKVIGVSVDDLMEEMKLRSKLLQKLVDSNLTDYKEFSRAVNDYYKNPRALLNKYNINDKTMYEKISELHLSKITGNNSKDNNKQTNEELKTKKSETGNSDNNINNKPKKVVRKVG